MLKWSNLAGKQADFLAKRARVICATGTGNLYSPAAARVMAAKIP
jgi:hypothetical protein